MTEDDRSDVAGVLLCVREMQRHLCHGVLATLRREPLVAESHLRQAQQRAAAAEIDLCRLAGVARRDE